MSGTETSIRTSRAKRWLITVGLFFVVQLIFMLVDGSALEPNINDGGSLMTRIGRWILESRLFTEWITPYSFAYFNMFMTIHLVVILIQAVWESKSILFPKK